MSSFTKLPSTPFTLPAGTYGIGCVDIALSTCQEYYAYTESQLTEQSKGFFYQSENKVLFLAPTSAGNRLYTDSNGKIYSVTNELFGMISMPYLSWLAKRADLDDNTLLYRLHKYTFDSPVVVDIVGGHFSFSSKTMCVEVETAMDDDLSSIHYSEVSECEED